MRQPMVMMWVSGATVNSLARLVASSCPFRKTLRSRGGEAVAESAVSSLAPPLRRYSNTPTKGCRGVQDLDRPVGVPGEADVDPLVRHQVGLRQLMAVSLTAAVQGLSIGGGPYSCKATGGTLQLQRAADLRAGEDVCVVLLRLDPGLDLALVGLEDVLRPGA